MPASAPLTFEVHSADDATSGSFSLDVNAVPLGTGARRLLDPDPNRRQAVLSPDGATLLTLEDEPETSRHHVRLRRLADMTVRSTFSITSELRPIRLFFSPDSRRLAGLVDDSSGRVVVLDVAAGRMERMIQAHDGQIWSVSFVPEGQLLLSSGADKLVRLWDLATGAEVRRFAGHTDAVTQAVASPDGRLVLSSSKDNTLRVWDMDTGLELRRYERLDSSFTGVEVSPDGKTAATLEGKGRTASILLWSPATAAPIRQLPRPYISSGRLSSFSADGRWLFTTWRNGMNVWDVATGHEVGRLVGDAPWARSTFTPDGKAILGLGYDGSVWWWDLAGVGAP